MTAAAYIRRSAADDQNPGLDSEGRQEAAVQRLCGEDVVIYKDWGVSGSAAKTGKREAYLRLKSDIADGRVQSVCAESLSRLGRSTRELLDFMALCDKHGVAVRTDKEKVDTSSAMGRFVFTIMAAIGELELDMGRERSAGARKARIDRHHNAGLEMPGSKPRYGFEHVTEEGLTRVIPDQERIDDVLAAYRDSGTVRGAAVLLNERGIKAPEGGAWGHSTLRRVLAAYQDADLVVLPLRNARGRRMGGRRAALFAGLLRCHCGATMTPNASRRDYNRKPNAETGERHLLPVQYYCAAGRDRKPQHATGKYSVAESRLLPTLKAEAKRYVAMATVIHEARLEVDAELAAIEERAKKLDVKLDAGRLSADQYREAQADLARERADLDDKRRGALLLYHSPLAPSWDDVEAMNRHLRYLWREVRLGDALEATPAGIEWAIPLTMIASEGMTADEAIAGMDARTDELAGRA